MGFYVFICKWKPMIMRPTGQASSEKQVEKLMLVKTLCDIHNLQGRRTMDKF